MDEINVEQEVTKKLPVYQGMGDDEKSARDCENTTEDKDEDCILNNPLSQGINFFSKSGYLRMSNLQSSFKCDPTKHHS